MTLTLEQALLLLPTFPAVAFLLWVLWNMRKDASRHLRR